MGVVSVNLLFTGRGGKDDFEKHRTYKRVYEVITDSVTDDEQTVAAALAVADGVVLGASFARDPLAVCVGIDPEQSDESPNIWLVTVDFDTKPKLPSAVDPNGTTQNPTSSYVDSPLAKPAQWRFASIDTEEPLTEWRPVNPDGTIFFTTPDAWATATAYKLGKYVQNGADVYRCVQAGTSAGAGPGPVGQNPAADNTVLWLWWSSAADALNDPNAALLVAVANSGTYPFDPPPMEVVSKPMLQVTMNVPTITLEYLQLMKNAVNKSPWRNVPARCAKCMTIEAGSKFENGVSFVEATWHIALDPDTFDKRILDSGWGTSKTINTPAGAVKRFVEFTDENQQPYGSPCPMDGAGNKLKPGDPPVYLRGVSRQTKIVDFNTQLPF